MCNRMVRADLHTKDRKRVEKIESAYDVEVLEVAKRNGQIQPTLINGRPVDRRDWPEVVRINFSCTATVVGKNCAITAAHCGDDGERGTMELYDGRQIRFTVIQMPQYQDNGAQYDLSVLRLHEDVDLPYAEVGIDHEFVNGQSVFLAGYGCTRPGGGGGNDGILRVGPSRIVGESGTDVVSQWIQQNGAALCFGDSGGPMFTEEGSAGNRVLIAVNSKGNIRDTNYNMRLDLDVVRDFLESVASRYDLEITGVTTDGRGGNGYGGDAHAILDKMVDGLGDIKTLVHQLKNEI